MSDVDLASMPMMEEELSAGGQNISECLRQLQELAGKLDQADVLEGMEKENELLSFQNVREAGERLLQVVEARNGEILLGQQAFESRAAVIQALLLTLQAMDHAALSQLDLTIKGLDGQAQAFVSQMAVDLKPAIKTGLGQFSISNAQLENYQALMPKVQPVLQLVMRQAAIQTAEKVYAPLAEVAAQECARVVPFAITFERMLEHVDLLMAPMLEHAADAAPRAALSMLSGAPEKFGQPDSSALFLSFSHEALVNSLTQLPEGWMQEALTAPAVMQCVTVPANENILARTARLLGWVENYKSHLNTAAGAALDRHWTAMGAAARVTFYLQTSFQPLRQKLVEALNQIQERLRELNLIEGWVDVNAGRQLSDLGRMKGEIKELVDGVNHE